MPDKVKIKLSELQEIYKIEDNVNNIAQQNSDSLKDSKTKHEEFEEFTEAFDEEELKADG